MKRWPLRPVGDLLERVVKPVKIEPDREYREIGIRSHCRGIFHKSPLTGEQLGSKRVYWVEPGCFTVNIVFAWEQAVAMTTKAEQGMIASHRFPMYRSKGGHLLPEFAYLYFASPRGKYDLGIASPGGAGRNKTLGQEEFKRLEIPVPPMSVQRMHVDTFSTWSRSISTVDSLISAKLMLMTGLMQNLLTPPNTGRATRLPPGWQNRKLGSLGTPYAGLAGKTKSDFGVGEAYIPYLNIFENSRVDPRAMDRVSIGPSERQNEVKLGDIFFTGSSETPEEVGTSSVLLDDIGTAYLNSFCFGFRLASFNDLLPEYARFLFRGPAFRKAIFRLAQGATRYNLSKTQLMKTEVVFPITAEQMRRQKILDTAEAEIQSLRSFRRHLISQRNGFLQQLAWTKI